MAPKNAKMIAEDSNPNLHYNTTFNSQVMADSSQLLSFPSQPPDIRNWFSSYEYESPVSDLHDYDFEAVVSQNLVRGKGENVESFGNGKDPNASYRAKRALEESMTSQGPPEDLKQKGHLGNQVTADSSQLLSFPSQPPDIRNWFSSYEYESPVSDLHDYDFEAVVSQNLIRGKEEIVESFGYGKDQTASYHVKRVFDESMTSQRPLEDLKQKGHLGNKKLQNAHLLGVKEVHPCLLSLVSTRLIEDDCPQDQSSRKCCHRMPASGDGNLSANIDISRGKLTAKYSVTDDCCVPTTSESLGKDDGNLPKGVVPETDHKEEEKDVHMWTNLKSEVVNGSNSEKEVEVVANNGFISTRSKKSASASASCGSSKSISMHTLGGKYPATGEAVLSENDVKSRGNNNMGGGSLGNEDGENVGLVVCEKNNKASVGEGQARVGRMALSDQTNFPSREVIPEKTGKWKCPQKGKPYIGPPLKQLRLERWVRQAQ